MEAFRPDSLLAEWQLIIDEFQAPDTFNPNRELIYPRFPELFVSRYAATYTAKDLAESFTEFVRRDELPEGGDYNGADKVRWLWEQPATGRAAVKACSMLGRDTYRALAEASATRGRSPRPCGSVDLSVLPSCDLGA